ncbi:hypothetical protein KC19_10G019500 [Ceratodon purpureus]|uniref:Uncharacterized protein n=1 Tax=Ceratodon purpureus TaxID=3225 RepID=A0A8T0GIF1_CERPU|nr:hypothetical protein KC19_10G019500 [Ceratodon purpureus]
MGGNKFDPFLSSPVIELNVSRLTTPYFFISDGVWQCVGFDSSLQKWRRLPALPAPDPDLFKDYLVCTQGGIMCMNVSKSTEDEIISHTKKKTRAVRDCFERDPSLSVHIDELNLENASLTAPYFFISDGVWQCAGLDSSLQKWRRLPALPAPDPDLFKDYLVCTQDGIMCMNVSKSTEDKIIVCNILTREWRELPPLNHRRNPVLMHLVVDALTQSYQVVVAGSSGSGDERLSRMTEVFDSRTWKWTRTGDLPGPDYALNDYQSGVYKDGYLYCIAFLDQEAGRGILRYNLKESTWLNNGKYLLPFSTNSTILQLVDSLGEVYLFSEQEKGNNVEHRIDRVEWDTDIERGVSWSLNSVMRSKKMGGRSLEVYPEFICVPYSESHLCVFNTIDHLGVVYDVLNYGQSEAGRGILRHNLNTDIERGVFLGHSFATSELGRVSRIHMRTIQRVPALSVRYD